MIISNAQIGMAAQHFYREEHKVMENNNTRSAQPESEPGLITEVPRMETAEPPKPAIDFSRAGSILSLYRTRQVFDLSTPLDSRARLNLMILESMYRSIMGTELKTITPGDLPAETKQEVKTLAVDTPLPVRVVALRNSTPAILYQRQEYYREQEALTFQAAGVVRTTDGQEINFSVVMNMSRAFVRESNLQITADRHKVDPLVINFDGAGAALSQTRFEFDLDSDGTAEQIASLRAGSGYLALDRNGDEKINNGSELFGPSSGRGFAELAVYDEDGNNFIDEGDSIYRQLRIWTMNEDGTTQLAALGDKNIGAIYLGHVSSPFQLKDVQNNSLGEIANSGIYFTGDGRAGVVQEINLTV